MQNDGVAPGTRLDTANNKDWAEARSTQRCCGAEPSKACATDDECGGLTGDEGIGCLTDGWEVGKRDGTTFNLACAVPGRR